ncbi:MAG: hypothetical protein IE878_00210 [Epsilonproteobacteria bacterium]|nr:hypothetical protein [Campylobacterota bacterium]MBD3838794.1 hypothetical protein [Campylobacterota bacterium]
MEYVITKHFLLRISQRGLSKEILNMVLKFGNSKGDKITLNKKMTQKVIKELDDLKKKLTKQDSMIQKSNLSNALIIDFKANNKCNIDVENIYLLEQIAYDRAMLMKILDKGGVTVVAEGNILITAYNVNSSYKKKEDNR